MWLERVMGSDTVSWLVQYYQHQKNTNYILVALATLVGAGFVGSLVRSQILKWHLAAKRREKRAQCQKSLKQLEQDISTTLSTTEQDKILQLSLQQLIDGLKSGKITPSEALQAYESKALEINKSLNCLVEPITEALIQAKVVEESGVRGPLYGVPVSIKDNFGLKGYDSTIGCANNIDQPYTEDCVLIQVLKKQGAIPFVKTNVPQTLMSWETSNPIFGLTRNPHDNSRGAGGSSGGEAALIAAGGSILGFGSDIAGSIRVPANMCGICGLKTTHNRISIAGCVAVLKGQTCVLPSFGPMGRDVDSLMIAMKAVCVPEMSRLDPYVPHKPFDMAVFESKKKLKIGYYLQDGFFNAVPAMERAVLEAKKVLEDLGHELVLWEYPNRGKVALETSLTSITGDGGKKLLELVKGDATDSAMSSSLFFLLLPKFIRKLLAAVFRLVYPDIARILNGLASLNTVSDWWRFMYQTRGFQCAVIDDWKRKDLDAVICPGFGCPALPAGYAGSTIGAGSYTMLYNILNFPAGSLPVTKVTDEDVIKMENYEAKNTWEKTVKKGMKGTEGLPVNVQVVALPWNEELVLRIMKEIESNLKRRDAH